MSSRVVLASDPEGNTFRRVQQITSDCCDTEPYDRHNSAVEIHDPEEREENDELTEPCVVIWP